MQPLNSTTTESFLLDATFVNNQIYLLDAKANLYLVDKNGEITRKKQILRASLEHSLPSWSAALKPSGEAVLLNKNTIRKFYFTKAADQKKLSTTHLLPKVATIGEKFVATIDSGGFLSIASLLNSELYFVANEIFTSPSALFFSSDDRWLFVSTKTNESYIYDLLTHKLIIKFTTTKTVDGGIFLQGGRVLLTGSDKDIFFYSWHSKGVMLAHILLAKVRTKAIVKSENFLFMGLASGAMAIVDLEKMEIFRVLELLDESVVFLKKTDNFVVAGGSKGALAIFDASKNQDLISSAVKNGEFLQIRQKLEENYFLLSSGEIVEFLQSAWENTIFPTIISLLEQNEPKRAHEVSESFLINLEKEQIVKTVFSLQKQIANLKNAIRSKEYDKADEILAAHKILKATNSGEIYNKEWLESYNRALDFLENSNQIEARNAVENFISVPQKITPIENLINFPKLFIKARAKLNNNDIKGFFEDVKNHPILTTMPHYKIILDEGKKLEKKLYYYALNHNYKSELAVAKELMRFAPFALKAKLEIEKLKIELSFQDSILKNSFAAALDLANEHLFLLDSSNFVLLYAPYQKRFNHARSVAESGDCAGLMLLLEEYLKHPLLRESAQFLFRIAYTKQMRSVVLESVVNWKNTFDNYTKILGCDLLISTVANDLNLDKYLEPYRARKNLRVYENSRLIDSVMNYDPIEIPSQPSSFVEKLVLFLIIFIVFIATTFVFITVMERPLKEYKDEIKKESPYKLFENISKEQNR